MLESAVVVEEDAVLIVQRRLRAKCVVGVWNAGGRCKGEVRAVESLEERSGGRRSGRDCLPTTARPQTGVVLNVPIVRQQEFSATGFDIEAWLHANAESRMTSPGWRTGCASFGVCRPDVAIARSTVGLAS